MLTNTIPVRVRLAHDEPLAAMLAQLQAQQAALIPHHHLGLADIQRQAPGFSGGRGDLFDTTVMFANYPLEIPKWAAALGAELRMVSAELIDDTHYPLRLLAVPGQRLDLRLGYRPDAYDRPEAGKLLDKLIGALEVAAKDPDRPIREIDLMSAEERERILAEWGGYGR
jgi:non-ribosomal peptide synthetase component F